MIITSSSNQRIKDIKKLIKDAGTRKQTGLYVTEGERVVLEVPPELLDTLVVAEGYTGSLPEAGEVLTVSDSVFQSLADTKCSQGILAVVKSKKLSFDEFVGKAVKGKIPFILILEHIQDPGNLGTIIRTAEGAGVTGVCLGGGTCDLYNPKVARSTMGSVYRVPVYRSENLIETVRDLKALGISTYAAHLSGNDFYAEDYQGPVAFMIGNEGNGLSDALIAEANRLIRIPMCGKLESLNAAVSAAVMSYEVLRQRITRFT